MNSSSAKEEVPARAGKNYFQATEIYFKASEIYFQAFEINFRATEITLFCGEDNLCSLYGTQRHKDKDIYELTSSLKDFVTLWLCVQLIVL